MFNNIGGKIKGVAQFITLIGIIVSVIIFLIIVSSGNDQSFILGFVILIVGCIGSWLSSLLLYGFGQLVENSDILVEKRNPKLSSNENNYYKNDPYYQPSETDERTFEEVIETLDLSEEKIAQLKELKNRYENDLIDGPDCCEQIRKILAFQSEKMIIKIISKL